MSASLSSSTSNGVANGLEPSGSWSFPEASQPTRMTNGLGSHLQSGSDGRLKQPDAESGIEDSADSIESSRGGVGGAGDVGGSGKSGGGSGTERIVEGGGGKKGSESGPNRPISPPIPIPSGSPRRRSLQQPPTQGDTLSPGRKHPSSAPSSGAPKTQDGAPDTETSNNAACFTFKPIHTPSGVSNGRPGSQETRGRSSRASPTCEIEKKGATLEEPAPLGLPTIEISEENGPAEASAEENTASVSKNGGGDSETSEIGVLPKSHPPKAPSPTKSPQHHSSPLNSPAQPNDNIPTDMSDSTDTEPDSKVTCLPSGESVVCPNITSHHQGREIINTVYALPVDTVFTLLFTNSKFMLDLYTARKTSDVVASAWQSNPETNQKLRQVTYTLTLPPNSFGPKVSHVTETQVVSPFSKHGEIYTVDAEACNAGIPYADSFFVSNHWCLTRESSTETRISVWSQVKYKKNVWGFMKGVIDKNAYTGVESLLNDINAALLAEVDLSNLKRTRRRRRRVGSKGEPPDVLLASQTDKVKDIHKSTQIPQRKLTLPTVAPDSGMSSNEGPVRVVVATLVILLTLNALLYYKLWALEEKVILHASPYPSLDPKLFRSGVASGPLEEWVRILQHQEALHAAEVERWRKSIEEAAGYLRKAEESLRNLHTSIPPHHASKLQHLLKQIQDLHEKESQCRSFEGKEGSGSLPTAQRRPDAEEQDSIGDTTY